MGDKLTLAERCRIHAEKMSGEGWYVTASVLWDAAEALDKLGYEIKVNPPWDGEHPPNNPKPNLTVIRNDEK